MDRDPGIAEEQRARLMGRPSVAPVWARNGSELFYASSPTGQLMAVDITTQPTFQAGTPRAVLEEGFRLVAGAQGANYDVSPDGQRFLTVRDSAENLTQLNIVLNWFQELKERVPVPGCSSSSPEKSSSRKLRISGNGSLELSPKLPLRYPKTPFNLLARRVWTVWKRGSQYQADHKAA